jgi:uncharacterized protein
MRLGILSDTHGLLRPEAVTALAGVDYILHAGDVGNIEILHRLQQIATTTAIRGNIDLHGACADLPETEMITLAGQTIYMLHSVLDLDLEPTAAGIAMVVSGHSHKPLIETKRGVLYLNPGSAGPRRFNLPITVAIAEISDAGISAEIVSLLV